MFIKVSLYLCIMDELKKQFIVDEKEYSKEKIPEQIRKVLRYCKVSKEGKVLLEKNNFGLRDNLKLILIARFLASKVDESISSEMTIDEIFASVGSGNKESMITRMKEIIDEHAATRSGKGIYQIVPFYIDVILEKLEGKSKDG